MQDNLRIAEKVYNSRLIVGTGKYESFEVNKLALEASQSEIVTVAIRRVNLENSNSPKLTDFIDPMKYTFLPNTAGCFTAEDALRTLRLAKEIGGWNMVKLEVLSDKDTLYPNMIETINTAEILISEGFQVLAYCNDDPVLAKVLEEVGCSAIMPLGSPIGSGLGILNPLNIRIIVEQSEVPVILDAGVGSAMDACMAMELGCDGVLVNSAIAKAKYPIKMAEAISLGVKAGRLSYLSKRMKKKEFAISSTPMEGRINNLT